MNGRTACTPARAAALLSLLLAAAAHADIRPSDACVERSSRKAAERESVCYEMRYGGQTRTLRIYAPSARGAMLPLLVVLHGGGGDGGGMEGLTRKGLNRIADRDGVIVVYPDGIGRGWNDGRSDLKSRAVKQQVDDIGFLRALPQELARRFPIDGARVYATGISNGGLMSYRLACDAADVYAAVAPVAANLSAELAPSCHPARPVSLLLLNGTDDPIMPWQGGSIKVLWSRRGEVLSTPATVQRWLELDRCSALLTHGRVDAVPDDATAYIERGAHCAGSADIDWYEIQGGGHTWPGGVPYLGPRIVGRVSHEFDANEVIWAFVKEHRLD